MKSNTVICNCMQVTIEELEDAVKKGATNILMLQEATGASTGCGRCTTQITDILRVREK